MTFTRDLERRAGRGSLRSAPVVAGIAFVLAWVAGLAVWPSNLDPAASAAQVIAAYGGSQLVAMAQSLLVHGAAAVALAVVAVALGREASRRGAGPLVRVAMGAGLAAVALSLVQCGSGLLLAGWAVPARNAGAALTLFDLVGRLDGLKMFALAVMAASGAALALRNGVLPRWVGVLGILLAAALCVSGVGYVLLRSGLAQAAFVSGPLLLLWVLSAGVALGLRRR